MSSVDVSFDGRAAFVGGNDGFARLEWSYRDEVDRTLVEGLLHDDAVPWKVPSYDFFNLRVGIRNEKWKNTAQLLWKMVLASSRSCLISCW